VPENVTFHGQASENGAPDPTAVINEPQPGSIVARLRAQAQAQQRAKQHEILVGGEFKNLYIRYKPLAPAQMDKFVAARQGVKVQDISAISATCDMMARSCIGIVGRYGDEEEVLEDEDGVVKLEHRLAVLLDMPRPEGVRMTSHEVVAALFGHNGAALAHHGDELATWMQNPTEGQTTVGED
jgi:hypothetical protein